MGNFHKTALSFCLVAGIVLPMCADAAPSDSGKYQPAGRGHVKSYNRSESENNEAKGKKSVKETEAQAAAEARFASLWFASAYDIPARVTEEMFISGYTYSDAVLALSLVNQGASLNEVLELRRTNRWDDTAKKVGVDPESLPKAVRSLINTQKVNKNTEYLHFMPDVRIGLAGRMRLPAVSPAVPSAVDIERFQMSGDDIKNVRIALENPNDLTEEDLFKPAGKNLKVADWVIASVLAKYKPFPIDAFLSIRTGEVVDWGDIAAMFSVDPKIFSEGPLASIYVVIAKGINYAATPCLRRASYPDTLPERWNFDNLESSELQALGWLMSLYYNETDSEREILNDCGLNFIDQALTLAAARMAYADVGEVAAMAKRNIEWTYIFEHYNIDLTGQEVVWQAACERDKTRMAERRNLIDRMRLNEKDIKKNSQN